MIAAELELPDPFPAADAPAPVAMNSPAQRRYVYDDGNKFPGGYGPTDLLVTDYWTLRARSSELFEKNLYARGLIRRLITNEINTGLHLETTPEEKILGFAEDELADWTESVENRFSLWCADAELCDHAEASTFGALQAAARMEALIAGDVLVVLAQDQRTRLPRVRLIRGAAVQTPVLDGARRGLKIQHGVELDAQGRQVAYWITQDDGTSKRLPAYGEKSGRRLAWLLYGTEKRLDDVRGKPILALVLQSLKEIDRYRDSTQRKAVINSMLAMFVKKEVSKPGVRSLTGGGAVRKGTVIEDDGTGQPRSFNTAELIPGLVIDELQVGEEPHAFNTTGTTEDYGTFEEAIIQAVAWAHEMPPEILRLAFSSNYAASQAAVNEFKMYLNKVRTWFSQNFCQPIYVEWLIAETLAGRIAARGLIEALRNYYTQFDIFGAWTSADWSGHIKPAVDLSALVEGYEKMLDRGLITYDRASRELTGTKYSKNVQKVAREAKALAEALKPLAELKALEKPKPAPPPAGASKTKPAPKKSPKAEDTGTPKEEAQSL